MTNPYQPSSFKLLPDVIKNLLIINGLMFLFGMVMEKMLGMDLGDLLGLHYWGSSAFHPYQFITHLFMHGNFMHLFSNMFALWMFGNILENFWGPKKFLIYYIITGLGAALIHSFFTYYEMNSIQQATIAFSNSPSPQALSEFINGNMHGNYGLYLEKLRQNWDLHPENAQFYSTQAINWIAEYIKFKADIPTVGASGAVFGVLLAFGMIFPNMIIYLYFAIPVKAKYFVFFYGLFELYTGFQNNPTDNVAHFAHLGGVIFGFILLMVWKKRPGSFGAN